MRKALMAMIMAATVMTPIAAEAQRRGGGDRGEARSERREARQERRESRQQVRQQRAPQQQARQQRAAQPQAQRAPGWGGSRSDPAMREHRERYDRRARENARRYGSEQQYREVVQQQRAANRAAQQEVRQDRRGDRRDDRRDWRQDRREDRRDFRQDRREDRRDFRQDRRSSRGDWNRGWRNDRRYDWQRWRNTNRNIFRGSRYYSPYRNWNYRRFSIGLILQPLFYSQRYWISDPFYYRLPPAPYGTQWVRYYDDVLLVDVYTGEVIDVIYSFFW